MKDTISTIERLTEVFSTLEEQIDYMRQGNRCKLVHTVKDASPELIVYCRKLEREIKERKWDIINIICLVHDINFEIAKEILILQEEILGSFNIKEIDTDDENYKKLFAGIEELEDDLFCHWIWIHGEALQKEELGLILDEQNLVRLNVLKNRIRQQDESYKAFLKVICE